MVQLKNFYGCVIYYPKKYNILHIIDEGTQFSAAIRLKNMETKTVWHYLIKNWIAINTFLPNRIIVDQGRNFGKSFIRVASLDGIKVEQSVIASHNCLNIWERFREQISTTVRKLSLYHPSSDLDLLVSLSAKEMNGPAVPDGLVPSALLFGEFPRINFPDKTRPKLNYRWTEWSRTNHENRYETNYGQYEN